MAAGQEKQDIWGVAGLTAAVTGSLLFILIPVEYFNNAPPGDLSRCTFFLLGYGILSSILAFKFPRAGRSLLRSYYGFFMLSCIVFSVAAATDSRTVIAAGMVVIPILICGSLIAVLKRHPKSGSEL